MAPRRKPFADGEAIATCMYDAAMSGPGFIRPLTGKRHGGIIVKRRDMWQRLRELQGNLSFTKLAAEDAMRRVQERMQGTWPRSLAPA